MPKRFSRWQAKRAVGLLCGLCLLLCLSHSACAPTPELTVRDQASDVRARARQYFQRGELDQARSLLEEAMASLPGHSGILDDLGLVQQAQGDWDAAQASFERAIRLAPQEYAPHLNLAILLMKRGISGRARSEFQDAVQLAPGEPDVYWNYAAALLEVGKPDEARRYLQQAIDIDPDRGAAHATLGQAEAQLGNLESAYFHFAVADSLGVEGAAFRGNFGWALLQGGRLPQAAQQLLASVTLDSTRAASWNHLGVVRQRRGQESQALAAFRKAHELAADNEDYRFNLAQALAGSGEHREVVQVLGDSANPRPPTAALLALSYRQLGRRAKALSLLQEAAQRAPHDTGILNNLGVLWAETGDVEKARQTWLRVLELNPNDRMARENLEARGGLPAGLSEGKD